MRLTVFDSSNPGLTPKWWKNFVNHVFALNDEASPSSKMFNNILAKEGIKAQLLKYELRSERVLDIDSRESLIAFILKWSD